MISLIYVQKCTITANAPVMRLAAPPPSTAAALTNQNVSDIANARHTRDVTRAHTDTVMHMLVVVVVEGPRPDWG